MQEIKPWKVGRLEMTLSHPAKCLERYGWNDAAAVGAEEPAWSLTLVFQGPEGQHCDLRAMGPTIPQSGFAGMTGLCQVLTVFGTHFAADAWSFSIPRKGRGGNNSLTAGPHEQALAASTP